MSLVILLIVKFRWSVVLINIVRHICERLSGRRRLLSILVSKVFGWYSKSDVTLLKTARLLSLISLTPSWYRAIIISVRTDYWTRGVSFYWNLITLMGTIIVTIAITPGHIVRLNYSSNTVIECLLCSGNSRKVLLMTSATLNRVVRLLTVCTANNVDKVTFSLLMVGAWRLDEIIKAMFVLLLRPRRFLRHTTCEFTTTTITTTIQACIRSNTVGSRMHGKSWSVQRTGFVGGEKVSDCSWTFAYVHNRQRL